MQKNLCSRGLWENTAFNYIFLIRGKISFYTTLELLLNETRVPSLLFGLETICGYFFEVLDYISGYIDVRIEPIIMPYKRQQVDWGTFDEQSGNWSGVFGYLQRGKKPQQFLENSEHISHNRKKFRWSH